MGYTIQDSFKIFQEEHPSTFEYYNIQNNDEEVRAFVYANMMDMRYDSIDNNYYHNVNFTNIVTGDKYRSFEEGYLYMFPYNDMLEVGKPLNAFSISRELKSIRVNENGLFLEIDDRLGNVVTKFYDNEALRKIQENTLSCASIDYFEDNLARHNIVPSMIINASKEQDNVSFTIFRNGELVDMHSEKLENSREPVYKKYYEYMLRQGLFVDSEKLNKSGGRNR